jgi:hypothetical protein
VSVDALAHGEGSAVEFDDFVRERSPALLN